MVHEEDQKAIRARRARDFRALKALELNRAKDGKERENAIVAESDEENADVWEGEVTTMPLKKTTSQLLIPSAVWT